MNRISVVAWFGCVTCVAPAAAAQGPPPVGPAVDGTLAPTSQLLRPAGDSVEFAGRPVDLELSPDGRWLFAKDDRGVLVVDPEQWVIVQELACGGGSMVGLAVARDGRRVYATTSENDLVELARGDDGMLAESRRIHLPGPEGRGRSFPCGVALSTDGSRAWVCLSVNNTLAEVDLAADDGAVVREIPVGVAPFDVALTPDGATAVVTDWGGRRARPGDRTATSAGTDTVVDERGVAASGGVSIVDLVRGRERTYVDTGRSASGLALSPDGAIAYVANANDDSVSVVDVSAGVKLRDIDVKADPSLPFGSMPNAVALGDGGGVLYAALAGNNAIAVIRLADGVRLAGLIPTAWFPGGIVARGDTLFIANIKGVGSRTVVDDEPGFNTHRHRGTLQRAAVPAPRELVALTAQTRLDARVPEALRALDRAARRQEATPVPVPARPGDPSVIEHVVYVIKENRTYDQILGDIERGNGDPALCIYGREITPNHHALADEYVLLDNYYCNGVLSADGHSWATEGNVTPYLERSFGGFTRSYTFGDDPLTYSSSGFIWDHVLAAGLSFRNYGELDYTKEKPDRTYPEILEDWRDARAADPDGVTPGAIDFEHTIGIENLRRYSNPHAPGWNMDIPDQIRADVFLTELAAFEEQGRFPNLVIVYLPNDHTSGTNEGNPTPRALVADNDLALGRIVEGLTRSRFWPRMAIFVNEDDPQNGFDHVDGHRSLCLVVSPWSRRGGAVVSDFYNQASVIHSIQRILGIAAQNQLSALAPVMTTCFTATADLTPYRALPANISLTEMNPPKAALGPRTRELAELSACLAMDKPDMADEDTLNRILWHDAKGLDAPYPSALAGAHGRGLAALGLRLAPDGGVEDDD